MDITFVVMQGGLLRPSTVEDAEAVQKHWKSGEVALLSVRKPRNSAFHRKGMALFRFLYEYWEPEVEYKGIPIEKDFESFRKDLTIMAGFKYLYTNAITGEVRWKAESLSFGSMEEERFEKVFNAVLNVGLIYILPKTFNEDDVRNAVAQELLSFA